MLNPKDDEKLKTPARVQQFELIVQTQGVRFTHGLWYEATGCTTADVDIVPPQRMLISATNVREH
jgi:hypothetical protein